MILSNRAEAFCDGEDPSTGSFFPFFIEPASLPTWYLGVKITHGPSTQQAMIEMECKLLYSELFFSNQDDTALRGFGKTETSIENSNEIQNIFPFAIFLTISIL